MMISSHDCTPRADRRLKRRAEIERVWRLASNQGGRPMDFEQFQIAADDLMEVERRKVLDAAEEQKGCRGCRCCPR